MNEYLYRYFALHKKLTIPGIGSFAISAAPAQLDFTERLLHAPEYAVQFSTEIKDDSKNFCRFLAEKTNITEAEATGRFNRFVQRLHEKLRAEKSLYLHGIGTITGEAGDYSFNVQNHSIHYYYPSVTAEKIIRKNASHTVKVGEDEKTSLEMQEFLQHTATKDRWWIAALILSAAGIGAILYYYLGK